MPGPNCPQKCGLPPIVCPQAGISEDCLRVDVYTPTKPPPKNGYPVMAWIYGGGFINGGTTTPLYEGATLATHGVIVVDINYRLGALGFLYNPESGIEGNMGLLDQIAALQWIQNNIAAFGGNPTNVLVFGESAGGTSTSTLQFSPKSVGLFHKAIAESNPIGLNYSPTHIAESLGNTFIKVLGCEHDDKVNRTCLNDASLDEILTKQITALPLALNYVKGGIFQYGEAYNPVLDGVVLPKDSTPMSLYASGNFHKMPTILGSCNNEGTPFVYAVLKFKVGLIEHDILLRYLFGSATSAIKKQYPVPLSETKDTRPVLSQIVTDYLFVCPIRNASRSLSQFVKSPNWNYRWNHQIITANVSNDVFDEPACAQPGENISCHGSELPFVFGVLGLWPQQFGWGPGEKDLSQQTQYYWTNFAKTGNPNSPGDGHPGPEIKWEQYTSSNDANLIFQTTPSTTMQTNYRNEQCNFWDQTGYFYSTFYPSPNEFLRRFIEYASVRPEF
eukprot:CAMPEP_0201545554 /NCGR_PEP_ID=MMETSP0173_2-20130828/2027_1 /ASSEMBLY_ACC=CAM_ASM_000268 /TAXON_ID=218659 /ORGANISM="Vexillifera sp., Strain DIVA3 564/2" /LENGTH=501 /DNA_ID=CAMNT_0047953969 /DNA_START=258 /DNA_END=1763 /DNA_ORIENTATION=-